MGILDVSYVGVMGWGEAPDYEHAAPDPLSADGPGILAHMNTDHTDAMILLARTHAQLEATKAAMTAADRLGFHRRPPRLPPSPQNRRRHERHSHQLPREVTTPTETRTAFVELVRAARPQQP